MAATKNKDAKIKIRVQLDASVRMDTIKESTRGDYEELMKDLKNNKTDWINGLMNNDDIQEITYEPDQVNVIIVEE